MLTLTINVRTDAPEVLGKIRAGLTGRTGIVWRAFNDAVDRYELFVRRRFDRLSNSGGGGEWRPLAESTVRRKLATGRGVITTRGVDTGGRRLTLKSTKVLVETGQLRRSLEYSGPGHVRTNIPNGIRVGTNDRTAKHHQYGTKRMPARKIYVPPTPDVARQMGQDLAVGVRKLIAEAARGSGASAP